MTFLSDFNTFIKKKHPNIYGKINVDYYHLSCITPS